MSDWLSDHDNRVRLLTGLVAFSILTTGVHFTHNFFYVDDYPSAPWFSGTVVQIGVIISWPLLTFAGLRGLRAYKEGRYERANLLIGTYSALGLITPLHFTSGNPDIPPFFYATIFTDGLAGLALLVFALYSIYHPLGEPRGMAEARS